jgi:hypothetical protein
VFKTLATQVNQRYKYLKYKGKGRITAGMKLLKSWENRYSAFKILIRNEFMGGN